MSAAALLPAPPLPTRALLALGAVTSVEFLETGMVMFAASQIMAGLGITPGGFALSYSLYAATSIFMLYHHQWMVERLGYRRFVLLSLLVFALGAVLCATADGLTGFAVGRAIQGLGGATFFTAGRMAINELPASARFAGLLTFIGSLLGAMALAPLTAALLLASGGWSALFWSVLPQVAVVAWLAAPQLTTAVTPPAQRSEEHWGWLVWLALGLFGLQYAIQTLPAELETAGIQPASWLGLASLAVLTAFAWRQWRRDRPLIDYRSLWQWRYLLGITLYFCGYVMAGSSGFLLPIFLQHGLGLSLAGSAGVLFLCQCVTVVVALLHAVLARRNPRLRLFLLLGVLLFGGGCLWLGLAGGSANWQSLLWPMLLCAAAIPLYLGPVAFGTFAELAPKAFSHGYQVKNIVRQLGLSSSIAVSTVLLQQAYELPAGGVPLEAVIHGLLPAAELTAQAPVLAAACAAVFLWLAAATLPVAVLLLVQRVFR
jgi:MFS family permease